MTRWVIATTTAIVGIIGADIAAAQVTPEDVWQSWQKMTASYGQALVADSVTRDGDTLVASGITASMDQDGASMVGKIDEMRFRDLGDGTVEITATDTYTLNMTMPGEGGKTEQISAVLTQPGVRAVAGGNANETNYVYDVPNSTMLMDVLENGAKLATIKADMTGITGKYMLKTEGDQTVADSSTDIQTVAFSVNGSEGSNSFDISGKVAAVKFSGGGVFLGVAAMENMTEALASGFGVEGAFSYGAGSFEMDATEGGKTTKVGATNESGHFRFALNKDTMHYAAGGTGVTMVASGGDIPFPEVRLSYGEASFDFLIPVSKTDAPTDFTAITRLVDVSVSDEIWGMLDPTGNLPRDPATVIVEANGKVRLTTDLLNEAAMAALGDAPPGEIHALTLSNITARAAGAELTGSGDLTFDNSDLTTFGGVPAPTGKVELVLKGGNGLLDKLVAMGLVPAEDAMGMRMMLAMFAKPGEGQDVLNSTLEFKDKGFYANGQRLQ